MIATLTCLLALLQTAVAQTPADPWRTVETEHYRLHYPAQAEPWALDIATQLESIRARVVEEVGWAPTEVVDVRIADPISDANGFALPFWRAPRMELWASPPEASSVIGHYRSWGELLTTHEDAHLVHLMREARNPLERALQSLTGIGPVTSKAPRWVIEGYATVVEGRLTGTGRPHADARAQLLRLLAQEGRLPTYGELSGGPRWLGYSFAYLVGSAYLEWLEERAGPGSLRDLWARMTATRMRSFDEAFEGVFGDSPAVLYGRFTAELTGEAMAVERVRATDGELFLDRGWATGPVALSVDGTRLAVPVAPRKGPPKLQVVEVEIDADAVEKRQERLEKMLERDPEDVKPVDPPAPPHATEATRTWWARTARDPRWLPDEKRILFAAWTADLSGRLRPDLFTWNPETGEEERITRGADLRTADPAPDGTWAVAMRAEWGRTQLVRVDLDTGAWVALTPLRTDVVVDAPRLSPDGRRLAWLENRDGRWGVVVDDFESGDGWTWRPRHGGPEPLALAWTRDGKRLLATVGHQGFAEVWELLGPTGAGRGRLTSTRGGALSPDPSLDGTSAYHLSMDHRGIDVRHSPLEARGSEPRVPAPPAGRPEAFEAAPTERAEVTPRPYGLGPIDLSPVLGGAVTAREHGQGTFGVRLGDPVGRGELLLLASIGGGSPPTGFGASGGRASVTYAGLPVLLQGDVYGLTDDAFGIRRTGGVIEARQTLRWTTGALTASGGGFVERPLPEGNFGGRDALFVDLDVGHTEGRTGLVGLGGESGLQVGQSGRKAWWRGTARGVVVAFRGPQLRLDGRVGVTGGGSELERFRLGGVEAAVHPRATRAWRLIDPAYRPDAADGTSYTRLEAAIDMPASLYAARTWLGDDEDPTQTTAAGLRLQQSVAGQPFFRLPPVRVDSGVACILEDPVLGWDRRPCLELEDWSAWVGLTWGR